MSNPSARKSRVENAVAAGVRFLSARQHDDGHWRDFDLPPGSSDAWLTGWVGYALSRSAELLSTPTRGLDAATKALAMTRRTGGWGFNGRAACDADSTAWVIRFLGIRVALGGS